MDFELLLLPGELGLSKLVCEKVEVQGVDPLRHPPSVVVSARTSQFEGPPFLSPHTPTEEQFHQLEEFLVITSGKKVSVFREKPCIDEGQDLRNFRKEGWRDGWKLEVFEV